MGEPELYFDPCNYAEWYSTHYTALPGSSSLWA